MMVPDGVAASAQPSSPTLRATCGAAKGGELHLGAYPALTFIPPHVSLDVEIMVIS